MDVIGRLAGEGRSVLVSTHVLHEVASLTSRIVLMNRGRLVAEGEVRQIRDLIDKHPHHIVLVSEACRRLAERVVGWPDVEGVRMLGGERGLVVETRSPDAFYSRLPELALSGETPIREVYSEDDSIEAVFKYLVNK
jgi:ABC-2 type transport system ATP-binding protein